MNYFYKLPECLNGRKYAYKNSAKTIENRVKSADILENGLTNPKTVHITRFS